VLLDVPHAVDHVPVPPGHVHPEQAAQQVHQVAGEAVRAVVPAPRDVSVQDLVVAVRERRAAGQHLVQEDSERPIVHRLAVSWQKQFYATDDVKRGLPNPQIHAVVIGLVKNTYLIFSRLMFYLRKSFSELRL